MAGMGIRPAQGTLASDERIADALARVGYQFVALDRERNTIRFTKPGVQINLGSVGKGFALDRCAAKLVEGGMKNFLFHGGQSSILARGGNVIEAAGEKGVAVAQDSALPEESSMGPAQVRLVSDTWTVGVPHPSRAKKRVAEIRLRDRALGRRARSFNRSGTKASCTGTLWILAADSRPAVCYRRQWWLHRRRRPMHCQPRFT